MSIEQPVDKAPAAKPLRTWRPMVLWTAGLLLALGLIWFVAAVAVPLIHTCRIVKEADLWMNQGVTLPRNFLARGIAPDDWKSAVQALGGPAAAAKRLKLYLLLPERMAPYRQMAIELLGFCDPSAVPVLVDQLDSKDPKTRGEAANALGCIGAPAKSAVPKLRSALKDEAGNVRLVAARSLGLIGPCAKEAVSELLCCLKDENSGVRECAALSLGQIKVGTHEVVDGLAVLLQDEDDGVRRGAAVALGLLGAKADSAAPELRKLLNDKNHFVSEAAAEALKKIKGAAPAGK